MNIPIHSAADGVGLPPAPQPYDFRNPSRNHLGRSRNLDALHADFAERFSSLLSNHPRSAIAVAPISIESLRYDEFCASLDNPTCFGVLRIDPPGAQACLDVPLNVMVSMIDALLCGQSPPPGAVPTPALTQIESGVALQIIERAAGQLADSFSSVAPITVKAEELAADPGQVQLMPADEVLTVMRFETNIADHHATMRLALPGPVVDLLSDIGETATVTLSVPRDRERDTQNLTQNIMQSAVELRALLADVKIRLSDVLAIQEGDLLTTEISTSSSIPLRLNDQTVRFGRLGQLRGKRAFQVTDRRPDDSGDDGASFSGGKQAS